jgi:hypothetical protein
VCFVSGSVCLPAATLSDLLLVVGAVLFFWIRSALGGSFQMDQDQNEVF